MKLTIITINFNNAIGLQRTMESVFNQTSCEFEYIVVDGGSTDTSCQVINDKCLMISEDLILKGATIVNGIQVRWISEEDNGIYHAMNKGIQMSKGEYVQFLNSGDLLVDSDVTEKMLLYLFPSSGVGKGGRTSIIYGNMLKQLPNQIIRDKGFAGRTLTMLDFYRGTLNHSPAYIKKTLFDQFGLYDESLKIVSDWKWYLQVIILNGIQPVYVDVDVTLFDMNGISSLNSDLEKQERMLVLENILPETVLEDYKRYSFPIEQYDRINKFWLLKKVFYLVERTLFKWEKLKTIKKIK